jgi:hypothetical protein
MEASMSTSYQLFEHIAAVIHPLSLCAAADESIRVHMDLSQNPPTIRVVRHLHDPANLLELTDDDPEVPLPPRELALLQAAAQRYHDISREWKAPPTRTTVFVNEDGSWAFGSR